MLKAAEEIALLKQQVSGEHSLPMGFGSEAGTQAVSLSIPVDHKPVTAHCHASQTAVIPLSKWPLIITAVPIAWLCRFDLRLFEAIIIPLGFCSIGVSEIKALHEFSN